jgi:hypothetical protein
LAILKEKCDTSDNVITQHVWIIASGHKQTYGVDYTKTFSSAAKMPSVHVVFVLAAQLNWELHHIKTRNVPYAQAIGHVLWPVMIFIQMLCSK